MAAEVALEVTDIAATQRELAWTLISSIGVVAVVGSVLGTLLARRIGRPLARLTAAASRLSHGDLDSPVVVEVGHKSLYGAGLGLSVVKAGVEVQGGRVGVEDRQGGGLVFWFTLPVEDK